MSDAELRARVVQALERMLGLLELTDASPFEVIAYRNGAMNLEDWDGTLTADVDEEALQSIPGIGKSLSRVIAQLASTGDCDTWVSLRERVPEGLLDVKRVPGLGLKRVRQLHEQLGVDSLDRLQEALDSGDVAALPGMGEKTVEKIRRGLDRVRTEPPSRY